MPRLQHVSRLQTHNGLCFGSLWMRRATPKRLLQVSVSRRELLLAALAPSLLQETEPNFGNCPTCVGVIDGTLGSCGGLRSCLSSFDDRPGHFVAPWMYDNSTRTEALGLLIQAVKALGGDVRQVQDGAPYSYVYATWGSWLGTDDVEFLLPTGDSTLFDSSGRRWAQWPGSLVASSMHRTTSVPLSTLAAGLHMSPMITTSPLSCMYVGVLPAGQVVLRSSSRVQGLPDVGRNEQRLEQLRVLLGWEQVPILRNRRRALYFVESPWDTFGPVPPLDPEYRIGADLDAAE
ncbi:hypothetical protein Agub_g10593 [Astrephomene gubernaculifera]|uniref:Uncharacterized protein n=1 Tax=Astrephomene gubernaculifera TaxID=47775 RepID=A0AAD3HQ68_9CHLO|nr:hypothetical protein Agub_g10593 [Astrephomene gubernaculifera]